MRYCANALEPTKASPKAANILFNFIVLSTCSAIPELSFPASKVAVYSSPCKSIEGAGYGIEYRLKGCFIT